MGIVIRQSFWSSGLIYLGVAFGYINTLILLPYFMDIEQVGLVRLIQSNGMILLPVAVLGLNGSYLKYYPQFKDSPQKKFKIFSFQVVSILLASIAIALLTFLFQDPIKSIFVEKSVRYNDFLYASLIILISQALFNHLISVIWSEFNITVPNFLNELLLRLLVMGDILLYGFGIVNFQMFVVCLVCAYISVTLILFWYLIIRYDFKFDWKFYTLSKTWIKKNFSFGSYTMLIATSSSIVINISYLITASMVGLEANGILIIAVFISTIIELPKRVIIQIISPFITQNFNDNKLEAINKDYKRSSINLGLISLLLAIGITTNLNDLFLLIPRGDVLREGFIVIVILAFARVFGMVSSISSEILTYSKYYRLNILVTILTATLMISLNLWLIPVYGITGAALSILISNVASNFLKMIILYKQYNFSPFTVQHLILLLISIGVFAATFITPFNFNPILNILFRSVFTGIIFVPFCYFLKVSTEMNHLVEKGLHLIKGIRNSDNV